MGRQDHTRQRKRGRYLCGNLRLPARHAAHGRRRRRGKNGNSLSQCCKFFRREGHFPLRLKFLQNLLKLTAQKNLGLSRRIFHTSPKTIRGRLLSYLSSQAAVHGSYAFAIPFDRQQLADYLCADRSALSAELGRMRDEGLLSFRKNRFELKKTPPQ